MSGSRNTEGLLENINIPYTKYVLDNGLRLIVHEDHKAPIVAVNVWYHVGSKNEKPGKTGFAHLFEHLMFNGSENFDDDYFVPLEKVGATDLNGTTNNDRTNYFQNVPVSALDTALWMESDRMGHLLGAIDQAKLDEQRGVVQNEKRQGENQPYGAVRELIVANTYPAGHPYSWSVIGSMEDLDGAELDDVRTWFQSYYGAANAVLSIAGDVDPEDVRARVERYFGDIAAGPPVVRHEHWVAKRSGVQRQSVEDRVPQARLYQVWNVPPWASEDGQYLGLLADVLSAGKTSRLYRRLVHDEQAATDVVAYPSLREIGGQFTIVATAKPGGDLATIETAIAEELARLVKEGPTKEELDRIRTQHLAGFVRGVERIGGFGGKSDILAMSEIFGGSPDFYTQQLRVVEDAVPADLQRVADTWLSDGAYVLEVLPYPDYSSKPTTVDRTTGVPSSGAPPATHFPTLQRAQLKNGIQVILAERHAVPVVNMEIILGGGFAADGDSPGLASMALDLLDEGTTKRDALAMSDALDRLGADLRTLCLLEGAIVSLSALKPKLSASLELFAEVIQDPAFDPEEFQRKRAQRLARIEQEEASPRLVAYRVLPGILSGTDHPYGRPLTGTGTTESVSALSADDLRAYHQRWFTPHGATLVIVGDTTLDEIMPELEKHLGAWSGSAPPALEVTPVKPKDEAEVYLIDRPGSQQSYVFAADLAPGAHDPQEEAIESMNRILGGSFTSRINMNLREDKHWSYGARSSIMEGSAQRIFLVAAPVQSDKTAESLAEIDKELRGLLGDAPVTAAELEKTQQNQILRLPGLWETSGAVLGTIRDMVLYDLPDDYYAGYTDRIAGLKVSDLQAAAETVVWPGRLVWLVVGDRESIEESVRALGLGTVTRLNNQGERIE